jgi:hypothetical protein
MEPSKRPKPHVIENISLLKRKAINIQALRLVDSRRRPSVFEILPFKEDKMLSCYVKRYQLQTARATQITY